MALPAFDYNTVLVSTPAQWTAVRSIRRESFPVDMSDPRGGDAVQDEFDDQPNSFTFLLESKDGEPAGTIRFSAFVRQFGWSPIPASKVFPFALNDASEKPTPVLQSSLFAISTTSRGMGLTPKLLLLREFVRTALACKVAYMVTIVRNWPTQLRFYSRMGLLPITQPKPHPWANRETVLLRVQPEKSLHLVRESNALRLIGDFDEPTVSSVTGSARF